jgi:pyruvate dehydrogenase E2 component (dihydrolipoamide acetyltransferase)
MPSLGADMDRGTVVEWRVAPGDHVERGDIVAVVDTDKSTVDVEVFESGVVQELLVPAGVEVEVGTPLAVIGAARPEESVTPVPAGPAPADGAEASVGGAPRLAQAHVTSPLVRHLADRLGVDTAALVGSGPGSAVTRDDVEAAARSWTPSPTAPRVGSTSSSPAEVGRVVASPYARRRAAESGADLRGLRGSGPSGAVLARDVPSGPPQRERGPEALKASVAALMARSKREVPHYYLRTTVELGAVRRWLDLVNVDRPPADRVVPAAVLCWAVARAAAANPGLNGHWVDGAFRPADGVQLGVAVSLRGGGLLAPVIPDAADLDAEQLMRRLRDLTDRARHGGLRASEMADPSITVTNLGDTGVEEVFGVIYPPQVAMVGMGRVVERPWAVGGRVEVRPVVTVTLAADHRATNGHEGARFLATIDRLLQDPEEPWSAPKPPASS